MAPHCDECLKLQADLIQKLGNYSAVLKTQNDSYQSLLHQMGNYVTAVKTQAPNELDLQSIVKDGWNRVRDCAPSILRTGQELADAKSALHDHTLTKHPAGAA